MKTTFKQLSAEAQFAKVVMVLRGIDERELARKTGYALGTIRNVLSCSQPPSEEVKLAIESALTSRVWSRPSQYRENQSRHSAPKQ